MAMTNKDFYNHLQQIVNAIVNGYQPKKIILFGSAAGGHIHEDSDADLAVIKNTDRNFYDRIGDVSGFIPHGIPVDVLVYTPDEFEKMRTDKYGYFVRDEILGKGKILYEST